MNRPLVGLSAYREPAAWGVWHTTADVLPSVYPAAVAAAGAVPVLLPVGPPEYAEPLADRLDGLLLCGGADVAPGRYGEQPHLRSSGWRDDRDAWELALLDAAEARALPVLGICRGMQLMAVRAGGTLRQHLPDELGHEQHSPGGDVFGETSVRIDPDSALHRLEGPRLLVHCHHHQGVRTHPGYRAVAWAEDGTLEAMEATGDRFALGVQWHPEMNRDAGLFTGLARAAEAFSAARARESFAT